MKLALVWNTEGAIADQSAPFGNYVTGLAAINVECVTVCPAGAERGYPHSVVTFKSPSELLSPLFWTMLRCDAVVVLTWHRMTDILRCIKEAGLRTVALTDSDGQVSLRHFPLQNLSRMVHSQARFSKKLAAFKFWISRLLQARHEHRLLIENCEACDIVTLPSLGAVEEFSNLLRKIDCESVSRAHWLPYPVASAFHDSNVIVDKQDRVIAVGRWDAVQKNPELLEGALRLTLQHRRDTEVLIIGSGSDRFASLAREYPRLRVLGIVSRDEIPHAMKSCRILVVSSRWEGSPNVVNEMLCLGGTIVTTALPYAKGFVGDNQYGRIARRATAKSLAAAIVEELNEWDTQMRQPQVIADRWRVLLGAPAVAGSLINLLESRNKELKAQ